MNSLKARRSATHWCTTRMTQWRFEEVRREVLVQYLCAIYHESQTPSSGEIRELQSVG